MMPLLLTPIRDALGPQTEWSTADQLIWYGFIAATIYALYTIGGRMTRADRPLAIVTWGLAGVALTLIVFTAGWGGFGFNEVLFTILAVLTIYAGVKMLMVKETIHAAFFLATVLFGVAGFYLILGAELLAAVQILIYVGAVITLFLFTVMLTEPSPAPRVGEDLPMAVEGTPGPPGWDVESVEQAPADAQRLRETEGGEAP